ncbi:MAG: hemerythrin domain-containing protein [Flavobacteriales bacterium]|nr:hemerythrin domain-containing protein [Flavobacteriales bacterium]
MHKPIKRHLLLQDLSRDHHHGLLLSWKIRTGLKKGIDPTCIMKYVKWFWKNHLADHFEIEEKIVFPLLGNDHELIKKALSEHRKIKRLIERDGDLDKRLNFIESLLEKHIRFEERVLFNKIQLVATEVELKQIKAAHSEDKFIDNLEDPFWV